FSALQFGASFAAGVPVSAVPVISVAGAVAAVPKDPPSRVRYAIVCIQKCHVSEHTVYSQKEIVLIRYGLDVVLLNGSEILCILIISLFLKKFAVTVIYTVFYSWLRIHCGGYHCKSKGSSLIRICVRTGKSRCSYLRPDFHRLEICHTRQMRKKKHRKSASLISLYPVIQRILQDHSSIIFNGHTGSARYSSPVPLSFSTKV
ncbi:MAG: accessory gene regulator B family protein, partial [Solobacterium sp.]|nr:accessory gene regulator B family protein [Solobacterium sp.]